MNVAVPVEVIDATTECSHDFACLSTGRCGDRELCDVDRVSDWNLLFLHSTETLVCPYRTIFGRRQVCTCPTHSAIHKRYGE